jgi:hypothetical protein
MSNNKVIKKNYLKFPKISQNQLKIGFNFFFSIFFLHQNFKLVILIGYVSDPQTVCRQKKLLCREKCHNDSNILNLEF